MAWKQTWRRSPAPARVGEVGEPHRRVRDHEGLDRRVEPQAGRGPGGNRHGDLGQGQREQGPGGQGCQAGPRTGGRAGQVRVYLVAVIIGSRPLDVLAWGSTTLTFAVAALALVRMPDEDYDLPPRPAI